MKTLKEKEWDITISGYKETKYHKGFLTEDVKECFKKILKSLKEKCKRMEVMSWDVAYFELKQIIKDNSGFKK